MDAGLIAEIRRLVVDLVAQRYAQVVADGRGGRLSEAELRAAVAEYGCTLVALPDEAWSLVDVFPHTTTSNCFSVDIPLWTAEEGRSDLTLSLTATKHGEDYKIEVDDLHVL